MSADLKTFSDLLRKDLDTLIQLDELLTQERTSLENNQMEELGELLEAKKPLLIQIQQHARERTEWIKNTKIPKAKLFDLLEQKAPPVMASFRECEQRLREIKQKNDVNGQIIARSQQRVVRLMQIIRGQSQQAQLYGQNGTTDAYGSKQTLAQA
ncbi:flagellar biosynthesis protein FlgN [Hahella sp. CCB-MM4]|uniref:flagella synthesis protein FlgN n=1 Tax=Hahella sp. (strain CCB-MM4) TaxID=1926491 RepID=UPI000B9B5D91|nr:flagellar protein FlgN [Hahella sp. CCB-MM4]OZG73766.1 flagellar biosynthesis protein FlgN [Hahella sp. CCB-MM4]